MNVDYDILTKLQNVLANIFTVEDKIKDIPLDLNDKEAVLQKTKLDYLDLNSKCEKVRQELEETNRKYIEAGEERVRLEEEMAKTVLVRESENNDKAIEDAKNKEQVIFKNRNIKQKYLEELESKLSVQAEIVKEQEAEVSEERKKMESLIDEQKELLSKYTKERDDLSKFFPANLLFKFERIIRNKNGVGVVPLHGIICQGCYMKLPQQFANIVRRNDSINFCPYCSRILYYEKSEEDISNVQVYGDIHTDEGEEEFASSEESIFEGENLLDD